MQVLVFAERTGDVDSILEKLIQSGVEARAVHGGLDQHDRESAIREFKVSPITGPYKLAESPSFLVDFPFKRLLVQGAFEIWTVHLVAASSKGSKLAASSPSLITKIFGSWDNERLHCFQNLYLLIGFVCS